VSDDCISRPGSPPLAHVLYLCAFGKEAIMLELIIVLLICIAALWLLIKMLVDMLRS
jgi:hypothetical protein